MQIKHKAMDIFSTFLTLLGSIYGKASTFLQIQSGNVRGRCWSGNVEWRKLFVCGMAGLIAGCANPKQHLIWNLAADRITGGEVVYSPDAVGISSVFLINRRGANDMNFCTGTVISEDLILTAAHCVSDNSTKQLPLSAPATVMVVFRKELNIDSISTDSSLQEYTAGASEIARPKEFQISASRDPDWLHSKHELFDIALIKLLKPLPTGFRPAPLLTAESLLRPGQQVLRAGFGPPTIEETRHASVMAILRKLDSHIDSQQTLSHQILIANSIGSSIAGTSDGDSGGPAFISIRGNLVLAAVCSNGQAYSRNPNSGFESVPHRITWIKTAALRLQSRSEIRLVGTDE